MQGDFGRKSLAAVRTKRSEKSVIHLNPYALENFFLDDSL